MPHVDCTYAKPNIMDGVLCVCVCLILLLYHYTILSLSSRRRRSSNSQLNEQAAPLSNFHRSPKRNTLLLMIWNVVVFVFVNESPFLLLKSLHLLTNLSPLYLPAIVKSGFCYKLCLCVCVCMFRDPI